MPRPWFSLCVLCATVALAGCQQRNQFVPPPPAKVTVARPVQRSIADSIEFTGNTRATATVEIRPRINGYLDAVKFEDGTNVQKGDLLFLIEPTPFKVELDRANAELKRAQAALQLAEADFNRAQGLSKQNAISRADFETKAAELETAKANVQAAEAAVKQAQLNLSYTEIRAPISGRIGRHLIDAGNLVYAGQSMLAMIETIDPIHAYFNVSEQELLRFMAMLRANELPDPDKQPPVLELAVANETGFPHQGYLDYRELGLDPSTGTAVRRGVFPNPDLTLVPGMFVRIRARIGQPVPRLLLPEQSIATDQRGEYVLVVNAEKVVEERRVRLGIANAGMRVILEGVKPDDSVVINGIQRARPGATVDPQSVDLTLTAEADTAEGPENGYQESGTAAASDAEAAPEVTATKPAASPTATKHD